MATSNALEKGDLILLTGGTGWLGSHIADQALRHGLRLRLAVRDAKKGESVVKALKGIHGNDAHIETVIVEKFDISGAYDDAIKGVQGVVHAASLVDASGTYQTLVTDAVGGFKTILAASLEEPSIKRVVLTSSSSALGSPNVGNKEPQHLTTSSWNDKVVEHATADPQGTPGPDLYQAGKTLSEKYAWEFYRENKPKWILNTICPNLNLGGRLPGFEFQSSGGVVREIVLNGDSLGLTGLFNPQYHIDPEDTAILHIVALLNPQVKNERVLGYVNRFTWNDVIDLGKKIKPNANSAEKTEARGAVDNTTVEQERMRELLAPYGGPKSLEESIRRNLEPSLVEAGI